LEPFDNRLCDLKLSPAINRLHEEAGKCWARAGAEVKGIGNQARFFPAFIDCQIEALRRYLEEVDRVCREVRLIDGNEISPEFIRTVLVPRFSTVIAARKGAIQHELELHRMRTGEHNPSAQHHLIQKLNHLQGELATQYEIEAIEIAKRIRLKNSATANTRLGFTTASKTPPTSGGEEMHLTRPIADLWRDFRENFQALANEEERERAAQRDCFLAAYCNYREHPEVWEKGKPEQGLFCLLKCPAIGLWTISDGVSEHFQARFRALASRAGIALGAQKGTDPEDFWLHRLYLDLLENRSDQLFAASKEGGMIPRVCVASSTFCSRLERVALENYASTGQLQGEQSGVPIWGRRPEPPIIQDLVSFSLPSGCTDADIVLSIAELRKLRVEGMPDALRDTPHPRGKTIFRSAAAVLDGITAKHQNLYWTVSGGVLRFATMYAAIEAQKTPLIPESQKAHLRADKTSWGRNIDTLRKECGWSFEELAAKTGIDKKLVLSHVNKSTKPRPRTLREYAQAFTRELERRITPADLEE